jgi:predicted phosphodiesterase
MFAALAAACVLPLHEGPDPIAHWIFRSAQVQDGVLKARLGPDAALQGRVRAVRDAHGESLHFDGRLAHAIAAETPRDSLPWLPKKHITVSAWVAVEKPQAEAGILGMFQDDGDTEKGWILGHSHDRFVWGLSTKGADDGDGKLTYLSGKTAFELGRLYHVAASYDGETMRLFVNGRLDAESREQSGDILYPERAWLTLAAYKDTNELNLFQGRIREVSLYDVAATEAWARHEYDDAMELAALPAVKEYPQDQKWVVKPYLQFATREGITVMCETSRPGRAKVRYGLTSAKMDQTAYGEPGKTIHEVKLSGLNEDDYYFYQIEVEEGEGQYLDSDIFTFQTAAKVENPYGFAVIGDTQGPAMPVTKPLAELMWSHRPRFVLHAGDLVDKGTLKQQWVEEYFPGLEPFSARIPVYPVLGNHEEDSKHYYEYMSLPAPEYWYTFEYGNAQFFMVDSNRDVRPGSPQHNWLKSELEKSTARWKMVVHHHPGWSSDDDDYGDLWKGRSVWGDLRIRPLTELYDAYGVDVVWNGHIHSYERTWPMLAGKAVERGGPVYVVTGGGGGGLETPGPIRPWFQHTARRGHHFVIVAVNGGILDMKAYDQEGRLFDVMRIEKP